MPEESFADSAAMNFRWLEDGLLAGCRGPRTDADFAFLARVGIRALVRLAGEDETGVCASDVEQHGIEDGYEPVEDWTAPLQEQIDRAVAFINRALSAGKPVAVSCGAGYGRTGTVLGCYLVSKGLSAQAATGLLIEASPCSREILRVPGQKDAIIEFHPRAKEAQSVG